MKSIIIIILSLLLLRLTIGECFLISCQKASLFEVFVNAK